MRKVLQSLIFSTMIFSLLSFTLTMKVDTTKVKSLNNEYSKIEKGKSIVKDTTINTKGESVIATVKNEIKNESLKDTVLTNIDTLDSTNLDISPINNLDTVPYNIDNTILETSFIDNLIIKVKRIAFTIIKVLLAILLISLIYFVFVYIRDKNMKIKYLKLENSSLRSQLLNNENQINSLKSSLENLKKGKTSIDEIKTVEEINAIKSKVIAEIENENKLLKDELSILTKDCENRWITLGHSAPGSMHLKSTPSIPCQDSHYFELLENGWILSVVCDGAGSAKLSNLGSELIAKTAIPLNLKSGLSKLSWYKSNLLPSEDEWRQFVQHTFSKSLEDLKDWILKSKYNKESEKEFATTVIISLHSSKGILTANIGDGRGGFLNNQGELKALFEPFKGDESNSTVFITSPIWEKPHNFIKSKVINEIPLSVFILSDGLEKISFSCSQMLDGIWLDPNTPYRNFFYPVLKKIKEIPKEFEFRLPDDWKNLLENGNDVIKNESDDKTMIISFLK